jgi:hypothetical protein
MWIFVVNKAILVEETTYVSTKGQLISE